MDAHKTFPSFTLVVSDNLSLYPLDSQSFYHSGGDRWRWPVLQDDPLMRRVDRRFEDTRFDSMLFPPNMPDIDEEDETCSTCESDHADDTTTVRRQKTKPVGRLPAIVRNLAFAIRCKCRKMRQRTRTVAVTRARGDTALDLLA